MSSKAYKYLVIISGVICAYVMIRLLFFIQIRPVRTDVIQGIIIGRVLVGDDNDLPTAYGLSKLLQLSSPM